MTHESIIAFAFTVLGGVLIFVFGQITVKFIIEPLNEQAKLIGEIVSSLVYYANIGSGLDDLYLDKIDNINGQVEVRENRKKLISERFEGLIRRSWNKSDSAKDLFRQQASQLKGRTHAIWVYWLWALIRFAPRRRDVEKASRLLIGFSNSIHDPNRKWFVDAKEIAELLRGRLFIE